MNKRQRICGIYAVLNTVSGESYIGSSVDIIKRLDAHRWRLTNDRFLKTTLQEALHEYGPEVFAFLIVEECDASVLLEREQFWFDYWKPEYNLIQQASWHNKGLVMPDSIRSMRSSERQAYFRRKVGNF